ncbi:MAG TPA: DDE-type integrase/transposase/recombinase [Verrucomicrobiota bacterium]|nr:DDE-type integrase/transposase/recombinase [Verrucomicrobiota bacterium]
MTEEHRNELGTEVGAGLREAREGSGAEGRPDPAEGDGEAGEGPLGDEGNVLDRPLGLISWRKGKASRPAGRPLASGREALSAEQRLLILDTWKRSGLAAGDFAELVGVAKHTLHAWRQKFRELGPEGLMDRPRGRGKAGSRLPEVTRRSILMLKQEHPEYGCQRISDMLARGPALPASEGAVARVLKEACYTTEPEPTKPHTDVPRRFERARPNQLWQTDLFSFMLKRQNRRVYLVGFIDDHSRFMVGYGVWASAPTALVIEVFRAAVGSYRAPEEVLTDNGPQYVTWRGKSAFSKELERQGVKHLVARPKRPRTLGKIERFWGTLWRECLEGAVFVDLEDARRRVGHFIDHYNFHRPHQGIEGLVPADRYFQAAPEVLSVMRARVAENALSLAQHGLPKRPFYMAGQVGGKAFAVHAEGERVILTGEGERREEVELVAPAAEPVAAMPEPLAPSGVPGEVEEPEAELGPGESELDAVGALSVAEAQAAGYFEPEPEGEGEAP